MPRPKVTATLPDGRTLTADALHRCRARDGGWKYFIEIRFTDPRPDGSTVPRREQWWLPSTAVRPIPGEDYTALNAPEGGEWLADALLGRPEVSIHRPGCRACHEGQPITTEDARDLVVDGLAFVCLNCRPPIPHS